MTMLTIAEATRRLSHSTVAGIRARIKKGELQPVRHGSRLYLTEDELRRVYGPLFRSV